MFLDGVIRTIRAPFDLLRSKVFGVKNIKGGMKGDVARLKSLGNEMKGEVASNVGAAKGAGIKAKAAAEQGRNAKAPKRVKMGLFTKKKKCSGCGQKLHPTWDQCPYCGASTSSPASSSVSGPSSEKMRTMAIDTSAASSGGKSAGWLVPLEGSQIGELFQLSSRCVVGTAPDCDVVLEDPSISSRHAEFSAVGSSYRITDLGSTNGTYVNDKRVRSEELIDNDNVRLGRTNFKFKSMN